MPERTDLVDYYCTSHRYRPGEQALVTLHEGRWAFCPDADDDAHRWAVIVQTDAASLRAMAPPRFIVRKRHSAA